MKTIIILILVVALAGCASAGNKAGYTMNSVPRGEEGIHMGHAAGGVAKTASGILNLLSLNPVGLFDLFGAAVAFNHAAKKNTIVETQDHTPEK